MKPAGLEIIGTLPVLPSVLHHRFVTETIQAAAGLKIINDPKRQIIGTARNRTMVQLYGWNANITSHADNTGFIYGVCLNDGISTLCARDDKRSDQSPTLEVELLQGTVFRLDDSLSHWTLDTGPRIAAFLGPLKEPADEIAFAKLQEALIALADQVYYGAPRVSGCFVTMAADECYATVDFCEYERMLLCDVRPRNAHVINCGECGQPAVKVDHYWPYHVEGSRCGQCLPIDELLD